ncbi:MAG: class I SAM-dependent methyltransferase [Bacteroidota bacterium]
MVTEKIIAAYEKMAVRYNELIDHKPHNAYYDRPNTLGLLPDVKGKSVLDAGCGPGKYAEILLEKGAEVTAFDLSPSMIELAKKRNKGKGQFFLHDLAQPLDMLTDASFDIVLSALALHYVEDWEPVVQEFHRVLKPSGAVIISIEHPFFEYNYFKSTKYFEVEQVKCDWRGFGSTVEVNSFRRSMSQCLAPFTENGFYIDKLVEPKPTQEFEQLDPKHYKELNSFPAFLCIRAVRRN